MRNGAIQGLLISILLSVFVLGCGSSHHGGGGSPPPVGPTITNTSPLPTATVGQSYSVTITSSGGTAPYTYAILGGGQLPVGLTMNFQTGVIGGAPTLAENSSFSLLVTDANNQSSSKSFTLQVVAAPVSITSTSLATGTVGTPYSSTLTATGGAPPLVWTTGAGAAALPPGLTMSSSGVISGTPTAAGTYNTQFTVTDSLSQTATKTLPITVN